MHLRHILLLLGILFTYSQYANDDGKGAFIVSEKVDRAYYPTFGLLSLLAVRIPVFTSSAQSSGISVQVTLELCTTHAFGLIDLGLYSAFPCCRASLEALLLRGRVPLSNGFPEGKSRVKPPLPKALCLQILLALSNRWRSLCLSPPTQAALHVPDLWKPKYGCSLNFINFFVDSLFA